MGPRPVAIRVLHGPGPMLQHPANLHSAELRANLRNGHLAPKKTNDAKYLVTKAAQTNAVVISPMPDGQSIRDLLLRGVVHHFYLQ